MKMKAKLPDVLKDPSFKVNLRSSLIIGIQSREPGIEMAEGVTTRLQKEVTQHTAEISKIQSELHQMNETMCSIKADLKDQCHQFMGALSDMQKNGGEEGVSASGSKTQVSPQTLKGLVSENQSQNTVVKHVYEGFKNYKWECPKFDGEDFKGWYLKIEQFFISENVPEEAKVQAALQWHQYYTNDQGGFANLAWPAYIAEMKDRFAFEEFDDPMFDLLDLKHTGSVQEYHEEFVSRLNLLRLQPAYAMSIFLYNMKTDVSAMVRMFRPKTLNSALHLAKIVEHNLTPSPRKTSYTYKTSTNNSPGTTILTTKFSNGNPPLLPSTPKTSATTIVSNTGSPRAYSFQSSKAGSTKYSPGHKCAKSQLYQLYQLMIEGKEEDSEVEDFVDCEETSELLSCEDYENPIISLHAISGTSGYQTMRVAGKVKSSTTVMLVDSGSTHNFIDHTVANSLGLNIKSVYKKEVTVANGETVMCQGICKAVEW
ncbi:hypothetical protein COLO4_33791 [Corchorus olitorius]|uniref:Retrotransposon gag protein n=1 Tax=Corchorus olitorius TaxID=93759 RepID=A0A1R3GRF9_9ROSI|nr:hypothetical protein COLO4_33791 [Corchorus olitorius]